jgi:peptidylprolyl isomerase
MKTYKLIVPISCLFLASNLLGCEKSSEKTKADSTQVPASATADKPAEKPAPAVAATPAPKPDDIPAPADVGAPPADAQKTSTGLASKSLKAGSGSDHPKATDTVKVHYTGWLTNGKMFDSSVKRGRPATFPLNQVIPGWTEGLQLMVVGDKFRFWIPEELAYKGRPDRPQGMLVFDVELLEITK